MILAGFPTPSTEFTEHALHLWCYELSYDPIWLVAESCLDADEQSKLAQFKRPADQSRFAESHIFLREVLAHYLKIAPQQISYARTGSDKPHLVAPLAHHQIEFNLSHSGDLVLVGVRKNIAVGVDVECIDRTRDCLSIAKRFFCEEEYQRLLTLSAEKQTTAFFRLWALKEAIVKALGQGIVEGLSSFSVLPMLDRDVTQDNYSESVVLNSAQRDKVWHVAEFALKPGYCFSVASPSAWNHCQIFTAARNER